MDFPDPKYVLQLSYGMLLLAFSFRTINTLRLFSIFASVVTVFYCAFSLKEPLWIPCLWHLAYILLNLGQLGFSRWQRRDRALDPVESFLAKTILENFPSAEVRSFTSLAKAKYIPQGQIVIQSGTKIEELYCILAGEAEISSKGLHVCTFGPGKFLGEMSLLTKSVTRAEVKAQSDLRVLAWNHESIDSWVASNSSRLALLQTALGRQVVEELLEQRMRTEEMQAVVA